MAIIERWIEGEYIQDIVKEYGRSIASFYEFMSTHNDISEAHIRARKTKADLDVDDMKRIADTEPDANRARLKVDLRRWTASKFNSAVYGDKLDVALNQSIDISAALIEARARTSNAIDVESRNLLESKSNATDHESVDVTNTNENESEDIFS